MPLELLCVPFDLAAWTASAVAVIAATGIAVREARKPLYPARRADDAAGHPHADANGSGDPRNPT